MNKKYIKWFIVIAVIVIAAILIYVFRCKLFPSLSSCVEDPNKNNTPVPQGSPTTTWIPEVPPYNVGMFGPKIKALQTALGISADEKFGSQTKAAVQGAGYSVPLSEPDYNKIVSTSAEFVGKYAYALVDDVRVSNLDNSVYKIAKKDEYCGKIIGKEGIFYLLSGNYKVGIGNVYLK